MNLFEKLKNMTVLLIDDDEWIRDSLALFFTGEGCHLLGLASAEEAIEASKQIKYDIVFSDYKLPGMNGLEFFRQTEKSIPNAMKILITAYGDDEMQSDALKCGIDDFIQKPLTTHALERSLTNVLERHQTREIKAGGEVTTSK